MPSFIPRRWVVVILCSFIIFMLMGAARLSSLFFPAAIERYSANRTQASLPFVLCYTLRNLSGPLVGFLGQSLGLRSVTVAGCVLSSAAIGFCYLASDIITFTVFWGGFYGLGFGLGTILIPQIINQFFVKKNALANGIAFGGECLAGFILPALSEYLLKTYGLSGCMLLLSACLLHSIPAAMLLWKPDTCERVCTDVENIEETKLIANEIEVVENPESQRSSRYQEALLEEDCTCSQCCGTKKSHHSAHCKVDNHLHSGISSNIPWNKSVKQDCTKEYLHPESKELNFHDNKTLTDVQSCYMNDLADHVSEKKHKSLFGVFVDPAFILILITQSSLIFIYTFLTTFIIDFGRDSGVAKNLDIYLLMSLSIGDAIGRFFLGVVTDSGWMSNARFCAFCYVIICAVMAGLSWLARFEVLITFLFIFGLSAGAMVSVFPGMCTENIREEQHIMALASRLMLYAPMSVAQSPLIGYFRGVQGSYKGIFLILSANSFLCSLTSLATPWASRRRDKKVGSVQTTS